MLFYHFRHSHSTSSKARIITSYISIITLTPGWTDLMQPATARLGRTSFRISSWSLRTSIIFPHFFFFALQGLTTLTCPWAAFLAPWVSPQIRFRFAAIEVTICRCAVVAIMALVTAHYGAECSIGWPKLLRCVLFRRLLFSETFLGLIGALLCSFYQL